MAAVSSGMLVFERVKEGGAVGSQVLEWKKSEGKGSKQLMPGLVKGLHPRGSWDRTAVSKPKEKEVRIIVYGVSSVPAHTYHGEGKECGGSNRIDAKRWKNGC